MCYKSYRLFIILILTLVVIKANAKVFFVNSSTDIDALNPLPGDTLMMQNINWKDQRIVFKGKGTKRNPIVLTTEKPGSVILSGSSTLLIDGDYLIVDGLAFANGYSEKNDVIVFSKTSNYCRLTNTSIVNYNHPNKDFEYIWVSLFGTHGQVDHCKFSGKTHQGPVVVVWLSDKPNYSIIDHNYFGYRPDLGANGGEIIRVGTSEWSMYDSFTVVKENIFDKCDGETEIVSIKSCKNSIVDNLFYECVGTVTFRHGNNSEVSGNYFIGNQLKNTGGIRIIGENHKVFNNYLQGLRGTGLRAAISIMNAFENPELIQYWQVKNPIVKNNIIVDCAEGLEIGSGKNEKRVVAPTGVIFEDNIIIKTLATAVFNEVPTNSMILNNQVDKSVFIPGFNPIKVKLEKHNGLYQEKSGHKTPFWLEKKIGPIWDKAEFHVSIK